jgi:fermentation-respiration switch protein FrsA (DUF1100 family)
MRRGRALVRSIARVLGAEMDVESSAKEPAGRPGASRRETILVLACLGAVGLYLLDDAFVHPEPGTGAGDHLVSGLVPTAILVALAVLYPRLRAGFRAVIALGVGLSAFGAGLAVPVRHGLVDRLEGDDFTGLLATVAGLVLIVVGIVTLWRTRRLDESRTRRYLRRGLIGAVGLVVAFELVAPIPISFALTHKARSPVEAVDLGRDYETPGLETEDGIQLRSWYVPSQNGAAVIVFPGRSGPVEHARMLVRHGYGVLLLDRRGEGESDGDGNLFGWGGDEDLRAAIAFLNARPDVEDGRIGGLGLSVGGELMLEAAAETGDLAAVVSEGAGYRSIREASQLSGAADRVLLPQTALITAWTAIFANEGPPPSLEDLVPRISPNAVFFVYTRPGQGGEGLNPAYYEAAMEPKALWEVPGADHTGGIDAQPQEYERRVVAFFDRELLD